MTLVIDRWNILEIDSSQTIETLSLFERMLSHLLETDPSFHNEKLLLKFLKFTTSNLHPLLDKGLIRNNVVSLKGILEKKIKACNRN